MLFFVWMIISEIYIHLIFAFSDQLMFVLGSIKHGILMYLDKPEVKQEIPFSEKLDQLVKKNLRE